MKHLRTLLVFTLFAALFTACGDDDDNGGGGNGVDNKLLGYWKVDYSKTIDPATYDEATGKPVYDENTATIKEYNGGKDEYVSSWMFDSSERVIEIKKDNTIKFYFFKSNELIDADEDKIYKIEDGYLKWGFSEQTGINFYLKYKIENNILTLEFVKIKNGDLDYYVISRYSKYTK